MSSFMRGGGEAGDSTSERHTAHARGEHLGSSPSIEKTLGEPSMLSKEPGRRPGEITLSLAAGDQRPSAGSGGGLRRA